MDWMLIISGLLTPLLAKSFNQVSSEEPSDYLKPHYNAATGKMDPEIVRAAMPKTRQAILKARRQASHAERKTMPRFGRDDIYALAESKLIEAMNADSETVAKAYAAATELGDDE
jgi:hypothetical protein